MKNKIIKMPKIPKYVVYGITDYDYKGICKCF